MVKREMLGCKNEGGPASRQAGWPARPQTTTRSERVTACCCFFRHLTYYLTLLYLVFSSSLSNNSQVPVGSPPPPPPLRSLRSLPNFVVAWSPLTVLLYVSSALLPLNKVPHAHHARLWSKRLRAKSRDLAILGPLPLIQRS